MALIFNEQFESSGYDETSTGVGSNWAEVGNGTCDEDYATSSVTGAPARWDDKCLRLIPGTESTYTTNTLDSLITGPFYCRVDVIFESIGAADYNNFFIVVASDGTSHPFRWRHTESAGTITIQCLVDAVTLVGSAYEVELDTVYRLDMYYDATANEYEVKINGVSQGSGTATFDGAKLLRCYSYLNATSDIVLFDNIQIATDTWVPEDSEGNAPTGTIYGPLVGPLGGPI